MTTALTLVQNPTETQGNFMERNLELREQIRASGISANEIDRSIKLIRQEYKLLDDQLPDGHMWKYSKILHAEHCYEEVETHSSLFGFEDVECDVFKFMLFAHDIGRLEQGIRRTRGETVDDQDHGKLSVEHILKALGITTYSMKPIWSLMLRAIECHSFRVTPSIEELNDQPLALPLIQVMRDTDKLGGFDSAKDYVNDKERQARERRANWTARLDIDPIQGNELGFIDPPYLFWKQFLNGKSLLRAECRGYEAYMLQLLAWCFDVNTPEMLRVIIDRGGPRIVYDYLIKQLTTGKDKLEISAHRIEAREQLDSLTEWAKTWQGGLLLQSK